MADPFIKVGQGFRATCDIRVDGIAPLDPSQGSQVVLNYRRPDGTAGTIVPDIIGPTTVSAWVPATLNPYPATDPQWKNGYAGTWEFFPSGLDANGAPFVAKGDFVAVHPFFRNQS